MTLARLVIIIVRYVMSHDENGYSGDRIDRKGTLDGFRFFLKEGTVALERRSTQKCRPK